MQMLWRAMMTCLTGLLLGGLGNAMTVYDCDHQEARFKVLDLTEPEECPDPIKDYEEPKEWMAQIVQTDTALPVMAFQCVIRMTKEVHYCGKHHIHYGTQYPAWKKLLEVTPQECREAVARERISYRQTWFPAERGVPITHRFFSHGSLSHDHYCITVPQFYSEGKIYEDSYEETILDVHLKVVRGTVDTSRGIVVFSNGIRAQYQDGVLRDEIEGTMVWNASTPECESTVSEVYYGPVTVHRRNFPDTALLNQAIVMVADPGNHRFAGLVLRKPIQVCHIRCYSSQAQGLVVCLMREGDDPLPRYSFKSHFETGRADVMTQLGFSHLSTNLKVAQRFEEIQTELCRIDRTAMFTRLQLIAGADNPYALLDLYGRGHVVTTAGVAAYVTQCVPTEAIRADFPNCTEEIPVKVGEKIRFADPFSLVLKDFPTIVRCSDVMPVRWKMGSEWMCATPEARVCPAPERLNLTVRLEDYIPWDFTQGLGGGAFTISQLEEHRQFQLMFHSRKAVVAKVTNAMAQGHVADGRLGLPISPEDMEGLAYGVAEYMSPFFYTLGSAWNIIMGVCIFISIFKILLGALLRGLVLYRERGCGWWMVAAIWHTGFLLVRLPVDLLLTALGALQEQRDHMRRMARADGRPDPFEHEPLSDEPRTPRVPRRQDVMDWVRRARRGRSRDSSEKPMRMATVAEAVRMEEAATELLEERGRQERNAMCPAGRHWLAREIAREAAGEAEPFPTPEPTRRAPPPPFRGERGPEPR